MNLLLETCERKTLPDTGLHLRGPTLVFPRECEFLVPYDKCQPSEFSRQLTRETARLKLKVEIFSVWLDACKRVTQLPWLSFSKYDFKGNIWSPLAFYISMAEINKTLWSNNSPEAALNLVLTHYLWLTELLPGCCCYITPDWQSPIPCLDSHILPKMCAVWLKCATGEWLQKQMCRREENTFFSIIASY